jgi:hypothetical protein
MHFYFGTVTFLTGKAHNGPLSQSGGGGKEKVSERTGSRSPATQPEAFSLQ